MDSHPQKKKNQYKANQKSIHSHVFGRENQIQSIQSKSKPNPITQYYNTDLFIKKKNPIQSKPNPKPRKNQTHGETVTSLAGAARSVARRPRLVIVARPPLVVASSLPLLVIRCLPLVADRRSQIADQSRLLRCSASRYFSLFFSQSLTLSLSHTKMKNMNV